MNALLLLILLSFSPGAKSLKVDMTPKGTQAIIARQAERRNLLAYYKSEGHIGETDEGLMKVRTLSGLNERKQKDVKKLVTDENKDRQLYYRLLFRANQFTDQQKKDMIASLFKTRKNSSIPGSYYFEKKQWHKKH